MDLKLKKIDPLVIFNEGTEKNSTIVMIHPIGGQIHWYKEIAKLFDKSISIYATVSPNFLVPDAPWLSVVEMAGLYASSILEKSGIKRYVIVGWSFGCEIAFEVVKQLAKNSIDTSLVLLDPQVMLENTKLLICLCEVISKEYNLHVQPDDPTFQLTDFNSETLDIFVLDFINRMEVIGIIKTTYKKYYITAVRVYLYNLYAMMQYNRTGFVQEALLLKAEMSQDVFFSFMKQASKNDWLPHVNLIKEVTVLGNHYSMLNDLSAQYIVSEIHQYFFNELVCGTTLTES